MKITEENKALFDALVRDAQALSSEELLLLMDRLLDLHDKKAPPMPPTKRPRRVELPDFDIDSASFKYPRSRLLYTRRVVLKETGSHPEYYSEENYEHRERHSKEAPHFVTLLFRSEPPDSCVRDGLVDVTLRPKEMTIAFDVFLLDFAAGADPNMSRVAVDLTTGEIRQHEIHYHHGIENQSA